MSGIKGKVQTSQRAMINILAADDDECMRNSMADLLSINHYKIKTAASGREAMSMLKTGRFDILLLDLRMIDMDGHQVMDYIKKHNIDVLVIVVSGDASIDSPIESLRRGAYDYIRKPYSPEEMMARLDMAINKILLEKENSIIRSRLASSEKLYRFMVNSSPDIVYMLDEKGHFTFLNDKVTSLLGYDKGELIGKHYSEVVYDEDVELASCCFNERRTGERSTRDMELRLKCKNGSVYSKVFNTRSIPIEVTAMGVYRSLDNNNKFLGTYGVARDLTERKKAEETIKYQAYHDLLTGLPNRILFKDHLSLAMAQAKRSGNFLAVMFMDLDRFKVINDTLGHVMGDNLLRAVSQRLKKSLRGEDTLSRIGGDEFLILLPSIHSKSEAQLVADKLVHSFRKPFNIEGYELYVTGSIGITFYPEDGENIDVLIKNADVAMYHAKGNNDKSYQAYAHDMDERFSRHLSIEGDLRRSIEAEEFIVYYQPQIDTLSGGIVGMEALVRWQHPDYGMLAPSDFIAIAEETGLISEIGESLFRKACSDLKSWHEKGLHKVRLAINLSAMEVVKQSFVNKVMGILQEYGLSGNCLEIEITESVILNDVDYVIQRLRELSSYGVSIAIDDFGTGYSSLSYLQRLPINTLKIDRSFMKNLSHDSNDKSIVAAIIAMAQGLNLHTVAEGVETESQRNYLKSLGCDGMQGYLFSEPVAAEQMEIILKNDPYKIFVPEV